MSGYTIFSFGNREQLANTLSGLASMFESGGLFVSSDGVGIGTVGTMAAIIALLGVGFSWFNKMKFEPQAALYGVVLYGLLFVPKVDVIVIDMYDGSDSIVDDVPFVAGILGYAFSGISKSISSEFENEYSVVSGGSVDKMIYNGSSGTGFLDPLKMLTILEPPLSLLSNEVTHNMLQYLIDCPMKSLYSHSYFGSRLNIDDFKNHQTPILYILSDTYTDNNYVMDYIMPDGSRVVGEGYRCHAVNDLIEADITANITNLETIGKKIAAVSGYTQVASEIMSSGGTGLQIGSKFKDTLNSLGIASVEYENAMRAAFAKTTMNAAVQLEGMSPEQVSQYAATKTAAIRGAIAAQVTSGANFLHWMMPAMSMLQILFFAICPIIGVIMIAMGARSFSYLGGYFLFGFWIYSWMPVAVILNYMNISAFTEAISAIEALGGNLTYGGEGLNLVIQKAKENITVASNLLAATPLVTFAVITGSAFAMTQLSQSANPSGGEKAAQNMMAPPLVSGSAVLQKTASNSMNANGGQINSGMTANMANSYSFGDGIASGSLVQNAQSRVESATQAHAKAYQRSWGNTNGTGVKFNAGQSAEYNKIRQNAIGKIFEQAYHSATGQTLSEKTTNDEGYQKRMSALLSTGGDNAKAALEYAQSLGGVMSNEDAKAFMSNFQSGHKQNFGESVVSGMNKSEKFDEAETKEIQDSIATGGSEIDTATEQLQHANTNLKQVTAAKTSTAAQNGNGTLFADMLGFNNNKESKRGYGGANNLAEEAIDREAAEGSMPEDIVSAVKERINETAEGNRQNKFRRDEGFTAGAVSNAMAFDSTRFSANDFTGKAEEKQTKADLANSLVEGAKIEYGQMGGIGLGFEREELRNDNSLIENVRSEDAINADVEEIKTATEANVANAGFEKANMAAKGAVFEMANIAQNQEHPGSNADKVSAYNAIYDEAYDNTEGGSSQKMEAGLKAVSAELGKDLQGSDKGRNTNLSGLNDQIDTIGEHKNGVEAQGTIAGIADTAKQINQGQMKDKIEGANTAAKIEGLQDFNTSDGFSAEEVMAGATYLSGQTTGHKKINTDRDNDLVKSAKELNQKGSAGEKAIKKASEGKSGAELQQALQGVMDKQGGNAGADFKGQSKDIMDNAAKKFDAHTDKKMKSLFDGKVKNQESNGKNQGGMILNAISDVNNKNGNTDQFKEKLKDNLAQATVDKGFNLSDNDVSRAIKKTQKEMGLTPSSEKQLNENAGSNIKDRLDEEGFDGSNYIDRQMKPMGSLGTRAFDKSNDDTINEHGTGEYAGSAKGGALYEAYRESGLSPEMSFALSLGDTGAEQRTSIDDSMRYTTAAAGVGQVISLIPGLGEDGKQSPANIIAKLIGGAAAGAAYFANEHVEGNVAEANAHQNRTLKEASDNAVAAKVTQDIQTITGSTGAYDTTGSGNGTISGSGGGFVGNSQIIGLLDGLDKNRSAEDFLNDNKNGVNMDELTSYINGLEGNDKVDVLKKIESVAQTINDKQGVDPAFHNESKPRATK